MTAVDLALLIALSVTGGALITVGSFHDWRIRTLERDLWGDPTRNRRALPGPEPTSEPSAEPEPADARSIRDQVRVAELRLQQAKDALDRLRRQAP